MEDLRAGVFTPHLLVNALAHDADARAIHCDGVWLTRRDVSEQIGRYVAALRAAGVKKGSRIAILSRNQPGVLYTVFASMFLEVTHTALHPLGAVDDYLHIVEDAEIDFIIFDAEAFGGRIEALKSRSPQPITFLSYNDCSFADNISVIAAQTAPEPLSPPHLNGDEIFRLLYSGGTTGTPKAVESTYRAAHIMTVIQMSEWEWPAPPKHLLCAPLSHAGAAMFVPTLMRGGETYILPGFDAKGVLEAIQEHKINCVLMVPTMIYALLDHPDFDKYDLSSLEVIYYGSAPMAVDRLQEGIRRIGPVFFQHYGQAEALMTVTVMRRDEHILDDPVRLASCGRPVPWVNVTLLDEEGNPVPDQTPGEICVRGEIVMKGYLNRPELTAETFRDGWLRTGDVAIRGSDGFLRIVDRAKDMIISGGFNVYSREVEDALCSHPAISEAAVFGVPDERWGELVTAAVLVRAGQEVSAEELMRHVRDRKGPVQTPKRIEFVDAIPQTAVGKPDKKALRTQYSKNA